MSRRRAAGPGDRGGASKRPRPPTRDLDAQVLALREAGNSFSAIARRLEFGRATDAQRSFLRALGAHDVAERQRLVEGEQARLDQLEQRIRDRDAADPEKVRRRLIGVNNLREAMRP